MIALLPRGPAAARRRRLPAELRDERVHGANGLPIRRADETDADAPRTQTPQRLGKPLGCPVYAAREQASLERMGLGKEVQAAAQAVARDLQEAEASLQLTKDALQTQQNPVKTLEEAADALKASAQAALVKGDEAGARAKLVEKQAVTSKITAAQLEVADARERVARMQSSVAALAAKAGEVEAMIGRSVEASSELRSEIAIEDPLEAKFRDL